MSIATGTLLGRYEVRALIGAGGMGEVYRARDTSLGRDVAIKVLPVELSQNLERLRRFEQEARATSSLNHPNILMIFDIGTFEGSTYVVSELLEGETLRERLLSGTLPARKAIEYSVQVARGLATAHDKGIIHRDLKPENIFITNDGHAKILDFGLAKLLDAEVPGDLSSEAQTKRVVTYAGALLGSVGYMSPEQVRGRPVDARSDIFSLGLVMYEMITGDRAFCGDSAVETMNAILKEEPPPLQTPARVVPLALERVITHCLEKQPQDRFQTARDLAFGLESVTSQSGIYSAIIPALDVDEEEDKRSLKWLVFATLGLIVAGLLALSFFVGRRTAGASLPAYTQLTFRRGSIYTARFTPDGKEIFFSGAWNGNPIDVSLMRSESHTIKNLDLTNTELLSISSKGEMAVLLNTKYLFHFINQGTLARTSLAGGVAREMLENVQEADWSPDGNNLLVIRFDKVRSQLEYPIGRVLYTSAGYVSNPRISPKGDLIAFLDHPVHGDNRGSVMVVDTNGQAQKLTGEWLGEDGLAWSPAGDEIWFTATKEGEAQALYAVTLAGKQRVLVRTMINVKLQDISPNGEVLLTASNESTPITGMLPGETKERDLSWLNRVLVTDLSPDGSSFIFNEFGQGSGENYTIYLGKSDGSEALQLGKGYGVGRSPDGKWVISILLNPPGIELLPTGPGQTKPLGHFDIQQYSYSASWLPDGKNIVFVGKEAGHAPRTYLQSLDGGAPRPVTPEGITGSLVSIDGKFVVGRDRDNKHALYPLSGGEPRAVLGLQDNERVIRWTADGNSLYVYHDRELPLKIFRLNVSTGQRELLREITPADPAGRLGSVNVLLTPNGKGYIYAFNRHLSDLYLVTGLK